MNLRLTVFALVISVVSSCGLSASANEFTITVKGDEKVMAKFQLKLTADSATVVTGNEEELFDLKGMRWQDAKTKQWVTLKQCKAWADQSKAKTEKSVESAPDQIRPFLQWSLSPKFRVEKSDGELRLTSGQVDYVIEGKLPKADVEAYNRYAVLNSYKKAMTEKKLPPFAELKSIEEMKALGYVPQKVSIAIPGVPGAPAITVEIDETNP